jgi:hypothetical protein
MTSVHIHVHSDSQVSVRAAANGDLVISVDDGLSKRQLAAEVSNVIGKSLRNPGSDLAKAIRSIFPRNRKP